MRHKWIAIVAAGLASVFAFRESGAQAQIAADPLPAGVITLVVPLPPAGPADIVARLLAAKLSESTGHTFIVENRAGAAGNIGAAFVAKAPPDGRTWLYTVDSTLTINPHIYASQGFDAAKDLIPVARVEDVLLLLAVNAKTVPARGFNELVEYSKTRALTFGSAGLGSPGHLALEYLKAVSPIVATHVPYRGAAPAMQDLLAGQIDAAFIVAGVLIPHVKSGALRALAVSANERVAALPNVPTAAEAGIRGFDARFSNLLLAPSGTPKNIRDFIAGRISEVLDTPDAKAAFAALAEEPAAVHNEADARAWIASESARWGKIVKDAGIKAE